MAKKTLEEIERIKSQLTPITFLEELAQSGYLLEYVNKFMKNDYENKMSFREEIFILLQKYQEEPIDDIDIFYLECINNVLINFNNKTTNV